MSWNEKAGEAAKVLDGVIRRKKLVGEAEGRRSGGKRRLARREGKLAIIKLGTFVSLRSTTASENVLQPH